MKTGALGGGRQVKDKRTERRQEEDRDARAGKLVVDKEIGAGEYWRGERGRYQYHQWKGKGST